ncbi:hypothetical protein C2S52_005515 [Perilla frutescens var. hirtella]|nr:hypothetical protein C2S52_005515 [Perilla frutescens var. hirtella]
MEEQLMPLETNEHALLIKEREGKDIDEPREDSCDAIIDDYIGEDENSDEDEDFTCKEDSCDAIMDGIIFYENVDKEVEWAGTKQMSYEDSDSGGMSDAVRSDSDFNSIKTDIDKTTTYKEMTGSSHGRNFMLGQKFSNKAQFKEDVNSYAVKDLLSELREDVYCFMSDKQKGLISAFEKILPGVENKFCVRHLHDNMKRALRKYYGGMQIPPLLVLSKL